MKHKKINLIKVPSDVNIVQRLLLLQEKSFGGTCLPKTMHLANSIKDSLSLCKPYLNLPGEWSFEDKVLVLICPTFKRLIDLYYEGKILQMEETYPGNELITIDEILYHTLSKMPKRFKICNQRITSTGNESDK